MHQTRLHAYRMLALAAATAALVLVTGSSTAMAQDHVYFLTYFSNAHTAGAPDGTLRFINDGNAAGNLCASIYVFNADEEMEECCSCPIAPNALLTLSVNNNLTSNPWGGGRKLDRGVITVVSSNPQRGNCAPTVLTPHVVIRGWLTHVEALGTNGGFSLSVEQLTDSNLGSEEATVSLAEVCSLLGTGGSPKGMIGDPATGICSCADAGR
jgi:hypothetical protein